MELSFLLIFISVILIVALLYETKEYRKFRREVSNYVEVASQFIVGFETVKSTVNFNADIQRETIDKVNAHSKTLQALITMLELHDRALNLHAIDAIMNKLDDDILPPKKEEI